MVQKSFISLDPKIHYSESALTLQVIKFWKVGQFIKSLYGCSDSDIFNRQNKNQKEALTTEKQSEELLNNMWRPCSRKTAFLSNYHMYHDLFEFYLKQSDEAHLVYKQNLKPSLNKMSSYSCGKKEMKQKMENPIQIRVLVCLHQMVSRTYSLWNNYLWRLRINDKQGLNRGWFGSDVI